LANQSWLFDGEKGVTIADREKRTASRIAKHALQGQNIRVRAKSDGRTGGASSCLFYGSLAEKEGAIPGKRLTELEVEGICPSLIAGYNHRNHNTEITQLFFG
jgi:hypothetical protein